MPRTRVFKSGNSQAVRIPAELAYADTGINIEDHAPGGRDHDLSGTRQSQAGRCNIAEHAETRAC